jgi:diketogulonate reductase-like aldo/keto reductase
MRTVNIGENGPMVSAVGQGTWYLDEAPRQIGVNAIQHGINAGLTHIDTAEMYGDGAAEELVGEAIAGQRDKVFLVSKVLPWNATYDGTIAACENSLKRLRTDHLDSYLIHWRGQHPLEKTFAALEQLQQDGKIRTFGVSNFDVSDLEEAVSLVGDGRLVCNQVLYHLEERAIEHAVLPWCADNGVSIVGYSPFGHNAFPTASSPGWPALQAIAQKHSANEHQVALAFLGRSPGVLVIPKSANPNHITANAEAASLQLDDADIADLDAAFPLGRKPSHLPML